MSEDKTVADDAGSKLGEPVTGPSPTQSSGVIESPSASPNSPGAAESNTPVISDSGTTTSSDFADAPLLSVPSDPSGTSLVVAESSTPSEPNASSCDQPSAPKDALSTHLLDPVADHPESSSHTASDVTDPAAPLHTLHIAPDSAEHPGLAATSANAILPTAAQKTTPVEIPPTPNSTSDVSVTTPTISVAGGTTDKVNNVSEAPGLTLPGQDALSEVLGASETLETDVVASSATQSPPSSRDANDSPPNAPAMATINTKNPFAAAAEVPLPQWIVDLKEFVVEHNRSKEAAACLDLLERFERGLGFARSEVRTTVC